MKKANTITLLALLVSNPVFGKNENPVLGDWEWNPTHGICKEFHTYRDDGTATTKSGDEFLEKTYKISDAGRGMFLVEMTVTSSNGKNDCLGSSTAVGAKSSVYVMPLNNGGYFTCAEPNGMSCYGSASKQTPESNSMLLNQSDGF